MVTNSDRSETSLGLYLASVRAGKGLTLREVEEATGKEVSNAYLSQLENGRINRPSPHILHSLAEAYGVPYETLMEKAGYIVKSGIGQERHGTIPTYAIEDLTQDEERVLLAYLKFYRQEKRRKK